MIPSDASQINPERSYFARHGVAIAVSCVLSCLLTLALVFGIQRYLTHRERNSQAALKEERIKQLEKSLLGRWELVEASAYAMMGKPGDPEWIEFESNGISKSRWFQVTTVNGQEASRIEKFNVISYHVADVDRLIYGDPKGPGVWRPLKFTLDGDELILDSSNGIEKYKRARQ